jgi:hypothetical protein
VVIVLVTLIALLATAVPGAEACSCPRRAPACEAYWTADAIFRGRVDAIARAPVSAADPLRSVTVRFTVLESLKGAAGPVLEIVTPGSRSTCGYRFVAGREYFVYAWRIDGALRTGACSRTAPADRARADLEYARQAVAAEPLGRISGRVLLRHHDLLTARYRTRPMRDVPVTLRRDDFSVTVRTNRAGEFAASGLAAGAYSVELPDLPGRFRVEVDRAPVELRDIRGCAVVEASVYPDGRVTGRITDSSGKPVRGLTVDLTVRSDADGAPSRGSPERVQAVTGGDGRYELTEVPEGRFVVGINTQPGRVTSRKTQVFYPGVLQPADAALVAVPAGGRVELPDLMVPASVRFAEIAGVIFDTDRVPVEGARVYLRGPEERDFILTAPVVTDLSGRFTIAALMGEEYLVFAERPRSGNPGWLDSTGLVRVAAVPTSSRLILTLRSQH